MADGTIDGPIDGSNPNADPSYRINHVTFTPDGDGGRAILLTMESPFTITAGVKPNVNAFTARCDQYDLLGGNPDVEGKLRFYFNDRAAPGSEPVWWKMRIVDVEMARYGNLATDPAGTPPRIIEYRLFIADRRHNFLEPFGGFLDAGDINALPFDERTGLDKNGNPSMNTKEVVDLCLDAMGLDVTAPAGITTASPPTDLSWRGNHAPTELAKILDDIHWTMVIRQGGEVKLERIGEGKFEYSQTADHVGGFTVPAVERKGTAVVFCSAPTQVMDSRTFDRVEAGGIEFVCVDLDGKWRPLSELKVLGGRRPADVVRNKFADVPEEWRGLLRSYMYRCFRLDPKKYRTILREWHDKGERKHNFEVKARIAVGDGNGTWRTADGLVQCHPILLFAPKGSAGSVVVMGETLANVGAAVSSDPEADFTELKADGYEIRVSMSLDVYEDAKTKKGKAADDEPKLQPAYFLCGFRATVGGGVAKVPQGDVRNMLKKEGTVIIRRPELQLYQDEGADRNRGVLEKACELLAPRWLKGSGNPTETHVFTGFFNGNLSGLVNEISYTQTPPTSTVKVMHWWLPAGRYLRVNKEATGEAGGGGGGGGRDVAFPMQGRSEAQRVGLGSAGGAQPAVPLTAPAYAPPAGGGPILVNVYKLDDGAGAKYYGHPLEGKTTVTEAGDLAMPEGMTPGAEDVLILNLLEDRKHAHWMLYTRAHMCNIIGRLPAGQDGTPGRRVGVVEVPNPCETFVCALAMTGGDAGSFGGEPTLRYDWRSLQGDKLALDRQPQVGRRFGKVDAAAKGLGYFDNEGAFQPLLAFEKPLEEVVQVVDDVACNEDGGVDGTKISIVRSQE